MSTELATIVTPATGEVLDLSGPLVDLARYLDDVRDFESQLREAKSVVSAEILTRMAHEANWSLRAGNFELKSSSPAPVEEYDELALRSALLELADAGTISPEAVDRAIEPVVTYKARRAGITALRKLGGEVASVIDTYTRLEEKKRYVSVRRVA